MGQSGSRSVVSTKATAAGRWIGGHLVALLVIVYLAFLVDVGIGLSLAGAPAAVRVLSGEALVAAVALGLVALIGWWREAGLTSVLRQPWWLLLLAGFLLLRYLLSLPFLIGHARWTLLPIVVPFVLLIGFAEETFFRGLVMWSLRLRGPLLVGGLSAFLFGCAHFTNLLGGQPLPNTIAQVISVSFFGVFLAAMRWRMHSLWPLVATHALYDFPVFITPLPPPPPLTTLQFLVIVIVPNLPFALIGAGVLAYDQFKARRSLDTVPAAPTSTHTSPASDS